jgi:hypothetical protein
MTDTRHYRRSTILAAARELRQRHESGATNHLDYVLELNCYRLRDRDGAYWFLDPATERWYRFEAGRWRARDTAPDMIEGPDLTSFLAAGAHGAEAYEPREPVEPKGLTAAQALAAIVGEIRSGFDDGTLSSSDARHLLARQVLVDLDGGFWTQGIRSRRWYRFEDRRWHRSDHPPPAEEQLFHMKAGAQPTEDPPASVSRALPEFLLFGVTNLPESVTESWEPPLDFPDEVINASAPRAAPSRQEKTVPLQCPDCGAAVKPGQKFCTRCGARIAAAAPAR